MKEAMYYTLRDDGKVHCQLCPHHCVLADGKRGICRVRENRGGTLYSLVYEMPCAIHTDPIEKKPLYHFLPGSRSMSVGTAGCNLTCMHCQNWELSTSDPENIPCSRLDTDQLISRTAEEGCASISYTYNEPGINYEYVLEAAGKARKAGLKNVMVTNGYLEKEPGKELYPLIDAANVDLKGFNDSFYKKICGARLQPVLDTLRLLKQLQVWIEITTLIIPGHNDDDSEIEQMCKWIVDTLGDEYPLHFSAFHPTYKMQDVQPTAVDTLRRMKEIAAKAGIKYTYLGNVRDPGITSCPGCQEEVISRKMFGTADIKLNNGKCKNCGTTLPGVWS